MTRTEKLQQIRENKRKENIVLTTGLAMIFITIASVSYGLIISRENSRIIEKINSYSSDTKIYYLKQDIEKGNY